MKSLKALLQPKIYAIIMLFSLLMVAACSKKNKSTADDHAMKANTHAFVMPIQKVHNMETWKRKGALKTHIQLGFGAQNTLNATFMVETNGPGIRLEMGGDTVAVFDGSQMWVTPSDSAVKPFTLKTWAYFMKAPYKLDDPGTHIEPQDTARMNGQIYDKAKLTFDPGTGDSPDDWYILFRNQKTNMLHGFAYIVTYGRSVKEAEKQPHAITYENFETVEGVPVSTHWQFWTWSKDAGFSDKPIGQAMLTNVQFVAADHLFSKPEGAMQMKRPR